MKSGASCFCFKERLTLNPIKGTILSRFKVRFPGASKENRRDTVFYENFDICESLAITI